MKNLIVITGGNSGLGKELVKLFKESQKGTVLSISRTKREEIDGVEYAYGDISNEKFIKELYDKYSKDYHISYLINNAGVGSFGNEENNTLGKIQKVMKTNLVGLILNTTYALNLIDNIAGAKIVNIMSTAALKGNAKESLYCASKWGARGYTESLKTTFKGTNVKVVGVYPGGMNTEFWTNNRNYVSEEKSSTWMDPKHVAKVIYDNVTNDNLSVADITIERK